MGHGSAHASAHGSAPGNDEEEDDFPVEEVSPVKPKKPSRRAVRGKRNPILSYAGCIREISQSLSNNVPDNSPEQEAATEHSIPRRLDSPTSQTTQLPELGPTLTPTTGREHSQEMNNLSAPTLISQAPGLSRKRSKSPSSPFFLDAITFSDGKPTSEASELNPEDGQTRGPDFIAAAKSEIAILQIRANDAESKRTEDHKKI
ncbi:hypothetical protein Tco_0217321 [Tanacetum coccineum]